MKPTHSIVLAASLAALLAGGAQAQTVYRIVGPDGRVTFSDRPPAAAAQGSTVGRAASDASPAAGNRLDALPYALRQAATRYPVVLYSGDNCGPCVNGRNLLINRGIPFTERTVTTQQDLQAYQRLAGEANLPLLTIGSQQIKGFADDEWSQYLDAAGYPKTGQLPPGYQRPAPSPLAPARAQAPAEAEPAEAAPAASPRAARPAPPASAPAPGTPSPSNPAGIIF
ncbi:glutaredoxin family protein [Comamonas sp. NLF-1-9]|uniref:glutaredoxin family protein n=1 Tax=Comamonas sp. NLF-1-9 TaxID=2853163 RepID=UPI001C44A78A|nr:glutaredoxin family protein [Comamonas sp. NLF-1-9]QXL85091.1 glutaredoxin family protein [Comamonas sp. NLF-1-9]